MEIKTTEDIMYEYVDEEDHCLRLYDINPNVKWVRVDHLLKLLKDDSITCFEDLRDKVIEELEGEDES